MSIGPIDLVNAARVAMFDAVAAGLTATSATARDHVKQDTNPPFVQIGDIDWTNEGGKDEVALRLLVDVHTVYRGADRAELLAIMHANFTALHGVQLATEGVSFADLEFLGGAASSVASDGVTYVGLQTFELYAEAA